MWFSSIRPLPLIVSALLFSSVCLADLNFIAHPSRKAELKQNEVRNLYLGILRLKQIELTDQAAGQASRVIFYDKFLLKTESQLKQQWSILVFSGERAPTILNDDKTVFEYVKTHPNAMGYVSSEYYGKEHGKISETDPVVLFVIK